MVCFDMYLEPMLRGGGVFEEGCFIALCIALCCIELCCIALCCIALCCEDVYDFSTN